MVARSHPSVASIPVPRHHDSVFAMFRGLRDDPLGYFARVLDSAASDIVQLTYLGRAIMFVRHPDFAHHVLVRNAGNYNKQTRGYEVLRLLLGNGLVTSEGEFWKRQRRIAQPAFHRKRIAAFGETMVGAAEEMLERWRPQLKGGGTLEVSEEMMEVTLHIVCRTLLGVDVEWDVGHLGEMVRIAQEYAAHRTRNLFHWPIWVPTPGNLKVNRARNTLDSAVRTIIEKRRREPAAADRGDLLTMFMYTEDEETGERMNDEQLRDEVMTMFLAGHETTAMNLTWTLHLLSLHPEIQDRVREELTRVLGGRAATARDVRELELLDRVVKESMRVYSPVPVVARMSEKPDVIEGYRIPAGTYMLIVPYLIHRHPRLWKDPTRFDPDRFLPERRKLVPRLAHMPFSTGQRKCIGDHFAMMEAGLVLATILSHYRVRPSPRARIETQSLVTLRPRYGLPLQFEPVG